MLAVACSVMIVGNHSAGKSSFINWYIGERVVKTGVAIETRGFILCTSGRCVWGQCEGLCMAADVSDGLRSSGNVGQFGGAAVRTQRSTLCGRAVLTARKMAKAHTRAQCSVVQHHKAATGFCIRVSNAATSAVLALLDDRVCRSQQPAVHHSSHVGPTAVLCVTCCVLCLLQEA